MKIGNLDIQGKVILGPMAGITSLAYREFNKRFGVALSYSEMVSDCGIVYKNQRTYEYLETSKFDSPIGIQLFGFDKEITAKAIKIIENKAKYDILDINLGCPVNKVTKVGAGSAWLKDLNGLKEYMNKIVSVSSKPVTAKIRLGWDQDSINVFKTVKVLEEAGVSAIAIHCRTRAQGYSGKADYEAIRGLRDQMKVPLIISGDINSLDDAIKAINITKADFVMVARGAVGHPFLIKQINTFFETGERLPDPSASVQATYLEDFAKRLVALKGERTAVMELRGIAPKFFSGFPFFKKIRIDIAMNAKTLDDIFKITSSIKKQYE